MWGGCEGAGGDRQPDAADQGVGGKVDGAGIA